MTDMIEQIALALWNNGKAGHEGPGAPPYVYINVWPSEYARKVWLDIVEPVRPAIEAHIAEAVAALEADNAAHVRNTLDGYKVADEIAAERDALEARVRELEGALAPFARAEHIVATVDGDRIRCVLTYPADTDETFKLADLDAARKALHDPG